MANAIPSTDLDLFDHDSVRNARAVDDHVRELAPVVHLQRENIMVLGRFEHVSQGLADWQSFSSTSRPWHDPQSVRPEILLTDDPPRHTEVRLVIGKVMQVFYAADRGEITEDEAKLLVQILLSAAADTTVMTLSTAMRAFCEFPEQYRRLREQPSLLRAAFEESLRWDSPSRLAGRITARDVEIGGYLVPQGTRCGLLFAAANRDPRKWEDPDRFDIGRNLRGHVGWGYGVHTCVGRTLAQLEVDAMLGALLARIERFEAAGDPVPWMTTIGHGPVELPIRMHPS
jgi:cytochrome P450